MPVDTTGRRIRLCHSPSDYTPSFALAAHALPQRPKNHDHPLVTRRTIHLYHESPFLTKSVTISARPRATASDLPLIFIAPDGLSSAEQHSIRTHERTFGTQHSPLWQQITPLIVLLENVLNHVVKLANAYTPPDEALQHALLNATTHDRGLKMFTRLRWLQNLNSSYPTASTSPAGKHSEWRTILCPPLAIIGKRKARVLYS